MLRVVASLPVIILICCISFWTTNSSSKVFQRHNDEKIIILFEFNCSSFISLTFHSFSKMNFGISNKFSLRIFYLSLYKLNLPLLYLNLPLFVTEIEHMSKLETKKKDNVTQGWIFCLFTLTVWSFFHFSFSPFIIIFIWFFFLKFRLNKSKMKIKK